MYGMIYLKMTLDYLYTWSEILTAITSAKLVILYLNFDRKIQIYFFRVLEFNMILE